MPSLIPALYVPTAAARAAARKAFLDRGLYCGASEEASRRDWSRWEARWGDCVHWLILDGEGPHWIFKENKEYMREYADFTPVNSVAHFVDVARARRATK